ncbi:RNA 2',3'-cyclic phosphodiesterase [Paenibacillus sp. NPDC058071]|uniref:RNA 2',3'-cyclic phosphodiesterase n=1 Tax=Paenibacillus sp. NPDC058071 TaxID=3346326 RepID=UPI0036DBF2CA
MRLFVALPIPSAIADELQQWLEYSRPTDAFRKWTHPRDYHLTLQFLGDTEPGQLEQLQAALSGVDHSQAAPIRLTLNGGGTFGRSEAPRVLFARVSGELERLHLLQSAIVHATGPLGFIPEERPYSPHVTLARRYNEPSRAAAGPLLEAIPSGLVWEADRFVLMATHMNSVPMYETVGEYPIV